MSEDECIPVTEGGNIDMVITYMSRDVQQARSEIMRANILFKSGNRKEAAKLYASAKEKIASCRKTCQAIRTNTLVDAGYTTAYVISLYIPIINLLIHLTPLIIEGVLVGDSESGIDQNKFRKETCTSSNTLKNQIVMRCRKLELACDDKIRRCKD